MSDQLSKARPAKRAANQGERATTAQQAQENAEAAAIKEDRYVVLYSLDGGETFQVANDADGDPVAEGQRYVGLGKHAGEAKRLAVEKVTAIKGALDGPEPEKVVTATVPVSSFKPKAAKKRDSPYVL